MERVDIDPVEPSPYETGVERRSLSDPLETDGVALNRYRLATGERLSGLHAHPEQEEVFVVLAGEATFETLGWRVGERGASDGGGPDAASEVVVESGGAIRFAPGEFQAGRNAGDSALVLLAIGAPRDGSDVRVPATCPECGRGDTRPVSSDGEDALRCPDCGEVVTDPPPREEW
ncbi:cupin [Halogeometricum pallidum JCM 14848]|uniref:Cupin n=1 Tax=Halogeometricum pallidum JCM 14848 TaxID=1227487 RepID=M0DJS2_HALPD|nr:cupin domain-containing protein [Halogeometricum pallidum]ELZ34414.1 cupin [Halogeometricum pallidum JCM 14848]